MATESPDAVPMSAPTNLDVGSPSPPIVLFDGVCNLCNAWVQWIVRHDHRGVFRFAALQSSAAHRNFGDATTALAADSIVLVDESGRYTESEAILRIAQRLGGAWRLLAIARLLPRGVRDAAYRWVARNRYRWFGRQNACVMPAPELRGRFLDTDEWSATSAVDPAPAPRPMTSGVAAGLLAFLHRFVLTYFCVYVFPFPLNLPFIGILAGVYGQMRQGIVVGLANTVLGIHITTFPNGSGDTTYNYVEVLFTLALALVVAGVWTIGMRGRPVAPRTSDVVRSYLRYSLAATLFMYGWGKVIPLQMPVPGPDRLLNTIGNTSPMGLLWTLMGASTPYQIFAGIGEVVAGGLLVWRRTALAGSLVATAVLTNVVMLNFCFDVPVKLFSSHLLAMAIFLATPHAVRLAAVLLFNLPAQPVALRPFPIERAENRRIISVARIGLVALIAIAPVFLTLDMARQYGFLAKHGPLHGMWAVDSFERDGLAGRANEDSVRWVRLGIDDPGTFAIQHASGVTRRFAFKADPDKHTIVITHRRAATTYTLTYVERSPGVLEVRGEFLGAPVNATLRRLPDDASLLLGRGFHWINESPLNR